jgi:hypothetical protein
VVSGTRWDWQGAVAGCSRNVRYERKRIHPASLKVFLQRPSIPLVVWNSPEFRPSPAERRYGCALEGGSDHLRLSRARLGGGTPKWVDLELGQHGPLLNVDCCGGTSQDAQRHCAINHVSSCLIDAGRNSKLLADQLTVRWRQ